MPDLYFPTDKQFVDPKTGFLTKEWKRTLDNLNVAFGGLSFSNIAGEISLAQLAEHQTTHMSGGSDSIKIDELADARDVTDLNASTTAHGLLPKLSGNAAHRLNGLGQWV